MHAGMATGEFASSTAPSSCSEVSLQPGRRMKTAKLLEKVLIFSCQHKMKRVDGERALNLAQPWYHCIYIYSDN